jgi:WD40 repeat protein
MKKIIALAGIFLCLTLHSMESEELIQTRTAPSEAPFDQLTNLPGMVGIVAKTLPGELPSRLYSHRISQVVAQAYLRLKPKIIEFIMNQTAVTLHCNKDHQYVNFAQFDSTGDIVLTVSSFEKLLWNAKGHIIHTLESHEEARTTAAFNPIGNKVVTTSSTPTAITAKLWDVATGTLLHILEGHTSIIYSAKFNQTGDKLVTASADKTAKIWDVATGSLLQTLEGHTEHLNSAVFNPRGDKVATASLDKTVKIWDVATGTTLQTLKCPIEFCDWKVFLYGDTPSVVFGPAGTTVATALADSIVQIWNVATGELIHNLQHSDTVCFVVFNPTGDTISTASKDRIVRIWDVTTGTLIHILNDYEHTNLISVIFNPTGDKELIVSWEAVTILHAKTGHPIIKLGSDDVIIRSSAFNHTGDRLVITKADGTASIYDMNVVQFLTEDINLWQLAILIDIHRIIIKKSSATFDFNRCPSLWKEYETLPQAIRNIFDPSITQPGETQYVPNVPKITQPEEAHVSDVPEITQPEEAHVPAQWSFIKNLCQII